MSNKTVLVSGASVAGPALAYWLNRYGFAVTVVERGRALRPGGQAVDFKGETHRKVLEQMGILDEVRARATGKSDLVIIDENDKELATIPGEFTGGDVEILRGDLAAILFERTERDVEYLFGDTITVETTVLEARRSKSRPDVGIVLFEHTGTNQRGEIVCRAKRNAMIRAKS